MVQNEKRMLSISDVLCIQSGIGELAAKRIILLAENQESFRSYIVGERKQVRVNHPELGEEFPNALDVLLGITFQNEKRRKKYCEASCELIATLVAQVERGLAQLDPRFAPLTMEDIQKHLELAYIALVELLVDHPAKVEVTRWHRHYLVIRDMNKVAA